MKAEIIVKTLSKTRKLFLTVLVLIFSGPASYFLLTRLGFLMPLSEFSDVFCSDHCQSEQSVHPKIEGDRLLNYDRPLRELLGDNIEKNKVSIRVEKSKYRLTVFYNLQPIKSYPIVLGSNPSGEKLHEGDRKTPEGIYHIRDLYPHREWSKFIWLDYPTPQSWRKHFQAKLEGKVNWLFPIGSSIGIHGVPSGKDFFIEKRLNWTWGCISLKNNDVSEIYQFVKIGSLVEISN